MSSKAIQTLSSGIKKQEIMDLRKRNIISELFTLMGLGSRKILLLPINGS